MSTETTTRTEKPASTQTAKTVEKKGTGRLIVGLRKVNRKIMTSTTAMWEPYYMEKSKNTTKKKIKKNGWETSLNHRI